VCSLEEAEMNKDIKISVIEALNGQVTNGDLIPTKTCINNLIRLIPKMLPKIKEADEKVAELAQCLLQADNRDLHKEWVGIAEEWHELFNRAEIKVGTHSKCKFCGESMQVMCFPRYSTSDWVNDQCMSIRKCGAHRAGPSKGDVKWYSGEEWEDHVNIIDGVDAREEMRKRSEA
jgi:hypothetical protein